jgi:hypothetical protein
MLLSAIISDDKRAFKFAVPKLRSCENLLKVVHKDEFGNITLGPTPSLLLQLDKTDDCSLATCKIQYDESDKIVDVPPTLLSYAYSDVGGFTIPVVWSHVVNKCEIEITFTKPMDSRIVLKYDVNGKVANPTTDFWMSGMTNSDSEQVLKIEGHSEQVLVAFYSIPGIYDCASNAAVNLSKATPGNNPNLRRWGKLASISVLDFGLRNGSRSFFLKDADATRFQIYSKSATPLNTTMTSQRKVVLVYEDLKSDDRNVQELAMGEPLPEWKGRTVLYHWTDKPLDFLKVAPKITHVRIPGYLNHKQQMQIACLYGLGLENLQDLIHVSTGKEVPTLNVCL